MQFLTKKLSVISVISVLKKIAEKKLSRIKEKKNFLKKKILKTIII